MKPLFEDLTHTVIKYDRFPYLAFDVFGLTFFCAGQVMCVVILSTWTYDLAGFYALIICFFGDLWMISGWAWMVFCFPKRVHSIRRSKLGELLVARDYPCQAVAIPQDAQLTYNLAQGNFRLDLVQRGNAPHGLNLWFEYQGKQFWLSEASSNYREALYLLAEQADLRHDPGLHRWERYVFWFRWRSHFKQRVHLNEVIDEIYRILSREQQRPTIEPEASAPLVAQEKPETLPDAPVTHQGPEWNDEPQEVTGLQVKRAETQPRDFGKARLVMKDGQAMLIVKRQKS